MEDIKMGIRIKKGKGNAAYRELWAFTNAYPGMPWNDDGDVYEFAPFDETDIPMFDGMELNKVIGIFEL
jgi:hypothetical protein